VTLFVQAHGCSIVSTRPTRYSSMRW